MKKIVLIVLLAALFGCGAPRLDGPKFKPYQLQDPNKAVVYVYRSYGESYGWGRRYVVMNSDNKKKIILKHGGYYPLELNPGEVLFVADRSQALNLYNADQNLRLNLEKGHAYYIRLVTIMNGWSFSISLEQNSENVGLAELQSCRLQTDEDLVRNQDD